MAKKKKKKKIWFAALVLSALLMMGSVVAVGVVVYASVVVQDLPPLERLDSLSVSQSTKIYDRTGDVLLYEIFGEEKRTVVPFDEIPQDVKNATLAIEDAGFYSQPAFDIKGIVRAFIVNLKAGRVVQGGSTITQQLVKNVFLTPERTITRKVKELILAIELESRYSKDEIFSAYLNQIPYGSNAYGIEAASQTFFNKSVDELSLAEISTLAALPKAPTYYSPWGENRDELFSRRGVVLEKMKSLGYINQKRMEGAKNKELEFAPPSLGSIKAPHFSIAIKSYLVNQFGENEVRNGGLRVKTTLDWELQKIAERVVEEGAERNERLYNGKNASLVAQNPKTGEVLAMVGSRDYFNQDIEGNFNVATQGLRQPGSALKPFAYLQAFEKGFHPETVVFDVPTEFQANDPNCPAVVTPKTENSENCFNPNNFDQRFRGPTKLKTALAQSINVPSVKALYLAGVNSTLETLEDFGINTLKERGRYGLSLVLGGGEVHLVELVNAYSTLADEGIRHKQSLVLEVTDSDGRVLEKHQDKAERVFNARPVQTINHILSDRELRSGLFQESMGLTVFPGRDVALKTGTTNEYKDAWAMGYTPYLTVGIWAGNNDNASMQQRGSSLLAAVPMWSNFLEEAFQIKNYPSENFSKPDIPAPSKKPMLNGEALVFPEVDGEVKPQIHSILYWVDKNNPSGDIPERPENDSQFANWEKAVFVWAEKNISGFKENYNKPVSSSDILRNQKNEGGVKKIEIKNINLKNGDFKSTPFNISFNVESQKPLNKIKLFLNDNPLNEEGGLSNKTYEYNYEINKEIEVQNIIKIEVEDEDENTLTEEIIVYKSP